MGNHKSTCSNFDDSSAREQRATSFLTIVGFVLLLLFFYVLYQAGEYMKTCSYSAGLAPYTTRGSYAANLPSAYMSNSDNDVILYSENPGNRGSLRLTSDGHVVSVPARIIRAFVPVGVTLFYNVFNKLQEVRGSNETAVLWRPIPAGAQAWATVQVGGYR